ncbi:MAG: hypothetical protein ACE5NG_02580 [bacterium]
MLNRNILVVSLLMIVLIFFACGKREPVAPELPQNEEVVALSKEGGSALEAAVRALVEDANARLEVEGSNYWIERAFYYTASHEVGRTVYFDDRTKQLSLHFVPGDPRRYVGDNMDIAYMVDQRKKEASNLPIAVTTAAIDRAMATWDGVDCSTIPITRLPNIRRFNLGFAAGGFPAFILGADITHAGWIFLPPPILGVAIPYVWIDDSGNYTDINNDGKIDVAFWEIYYSNAYTWADDGVSNIDVETVALHEAGHGLDQGHFGGLFRTEANGKFHFDPRAVMNAGYTGPQRSLTGTDIGGHCSIWGSWPNN